MFIDRCDELRPAFVEFLRAGNSVAVGALSAWAFIGTASSLTHGWGFVLTGPAWAVLSTVTILPVGLDTRRVARAVGAIDDRTQTIDVAASGAAVGSASSGYL